MCRSLASCRQQLRLAERREPEQPVPDPPLPAHIQASMAYAQAYCDDNYSEVTCLRTCYIAHLPDDVAPSIIKDMDDLQRLLTRSQGAW